MVEVDLKFNYGFQWYEENGIFAKGYLFDKENNLFKGKELIDFFQNIKDEEVFKSKIIEANGLFSIIVRNNNKIFCAVDRTRTFPIFYGLKDNKIFISDSAECLSKKIGKEFIELNEKEFLTTGYVTGNETLLKDICQITAGNYIVYNGDLKNNEYFNYVTDVVLKDNYEVLKNNFLNILDNITKRLIKFANGKQIVVPLSGGYDSRLIVSLLKMHNYKNVFCFTYGKKDSFEVDISKKVANKLGYKWYFVKYNEKNIGNFANTKNFKNYVEFANNFVSISHIQDYFAVKYLKENNLIQKDAIFVPGHSGDFLAGSHIDNCGYDNDKDLIIKDIFIRHYDLSPNISNKIFKAKIAKYIDFEGYGYSIYENWDLKERQVKFIINANRVYESFGYNHFLPLWDKEMIEFFKILPLELKLNQRFYNKVIFENIFKEFKIDYKKMSISQNFLIKRIKKIIPFKLKNIIKNIFYTNQIDINNFSYIENQLLIDKNQTSNTTNGIIAVYNLNKIKSRIHE